MGKLFDALQRQLNTEYKQDAEDCLKIYDYLIETDSGHVWGSRWNPLVLTIFEGRYPNNKRRFKPTEMGRIFVQGLENKQSNE